MYTVERIARGDHDTVLYAVCCDDVARRITIRKWVAVESTVTDVVAYDYGDHTAFREAVSLGMTIALHLSRHRDEKAAEALRKSGWKPVMTSEERAAAEAAEDEAARVKAQTGEPY